MSDLKKCFGLRVKKLREEKGMTQEQLADHIDVTVETICHIERGIHGPRFDTLEKIADVLGFPVKVLFDFKD